MTKNILEKIKIIKDKYNFENNGRNEARIIIQDFLGFSIADSDIEKAILIDVNEDELIEKKIKLIENVNDYSIDILSKIAEELGNIYREPFCFNNKFYSDYILFKIELIHLKIKDSLSEHLKTEELRQLDTIDEKYLFRLKYDRYLKGLNVSKVFNLEDTTGEVDRAFLIFCHLRKDLIDHHFNLDHVFIPFKSKDDIAIYEVYLISTLTKIWESKNISNEEYIQTTLVIRNAAEVAKKTP